MVVLTTFTFGIGTITIAELMYTVQSVFALMNSLDLECPDTTAVAHDLMEAMDTDKDSNVTFDEFRNALHNDPSISCSSGGILHTGMIDNGTTNSIFFGQDKFDFMLAVMVSDRPTRPRPYIRTIIPPPPPPPPQKKKKKKKN